MDVPAGYELRAPTSADLDAVADVLVADELADSGVITLGTDFVRSEWSRADFDPTTDAWIVLDDAGAIVGYAQAMLEEPTVVDSWGVVHPDRRGRGVGAALLDLIERWASAKRIGALRFRHAINANDHAAAAMLRTRRMQPVRYFWHMQIDLAEPPEPGPEPGAEPGPEPDGIEIRAIDPARDIEAVHAVLIDAFRKDWSYHAEPFDRWSEQHARGPNYDPTLWLLATAEREPVGALTAHMWGDGGWVSEVGVAKTHRGRGIGAALLRRSFVTFARRAVPRVTLNVDADNPTGATQVYERAGMRVVKRWDLWERFVG